MNRIDSTFQKLAQIDAKGLFPFLVAGQGGCDLTVDLIERFQQLGASAIELGFPFSDPVADGPVIQSAFSQALLDGVTAAQIFQTFAKARDRITIPLVAMVSISIVYRIGYDAFIQQAADAGIDGLIVPDLSIEEAPDLARRLDKADMKLAMLVAPTTPADRQARIAQLATGFIYYVSVAGITGERDALPADLVENVKRLKELSGKPVLVGFGIKSPEQVKLVCTVGDGAIVGSHFVRQLAEALKADPDRSAVLDAMGTSFEELLPGLKA